MALSVMEPKLWAITVLRCRQRDFGLFCSCDLYLEPMTSYTNLTHICWRYKYD